LKTSCRVLLADDAPAVRQGVKGLLEREGFDVVGEAADGQEAVTLAQTLDPDVAVLDLSMPKLSGMGAAREIQRLCPRTHLILLTVHTEEYQVVEALRAGIRGYVSKTEAAEDLVRAIGEVSEGRVFVSSSASGEAVDNYLPKNDGCLLLGPEPQGACPVCGFCPSPEDT
jgi:two-component system, NarL family, response regulator NreC